MPTNSTVCTMSHATIVCVDEWMELALMLFGGDDVVRVGDGAICLSEVDWYV